MERHSVPFSSHAANSPLAWAADAVALSVFAAYLHQGSEQSFRLHGLGHDLATTLEGIAYPVVILKCDSLQHFDLQSAFRLVHS